MSNKHITFPDDANLPIEKNSDFHDNVTNDQFSNFNNFVISRVLNNNSLLNEEEGYKISRKNDQENLVFPSQSQQISKFENSDVNMGYNENHENKFLINEKIFLNKNCQSNLDCNSNTNVEVFYENHSIQENKEGANENIDFQENNTNYNIDNNTNREINFLRNSNIGNLINNENFENYELNRENNLNYINSNLRIENEPLLVTQNIQNRIFGLGDFNRNLNNLNNHSNDMTGFILENPNNISDDGGNSANLESHLDEIFDNLTYMIASEK